MPRQSPYRTLSAERRIALITHAIRASREGRELYVQRLVSRGGGFRAATLRTWPVDRLAREIVRMKAESSTDELDLLQLWYVDLEPSVQITFLDAAGVEHDGGKMAESMEPPYASEEAVIRGAAAVRERHGSDGAHYLQTIARYSPDGWPGIEGLVDQS